MAKPGVEESAVQTRRSWLRRNWKWVLAVWLGTGLVGAAVAFVTLNNSEARKMAIAAANSSPALEERLGRPLRFGRLTSGSLDINGAGGHAELSFSVSGPKGKGKLYVEARKNGRNLALGAPPVC